MQNFTVRKFFLKNYHSIIKIEMFLMAKFMLINKFFFFLIGLFFKIFLRLSFFLFKIISRQIILSEMNTFVDCFKKIFFTKKFNYSSFLLAHFAVSSLFSRKLNFFSWNGIINIRHATRSRTFHRLRATMCGYSFWFRISSLLIIIL